MTGVRPIWPRISAGAAAHPGLSMALFLTLLVTLCGIGWLRLATPALNTDLLSLVRPASADPVRAEALARVATISEQGQTWLVAHADRSAARAAAIRLRRALLASGDYARPPEPPSLPDIVTFYAPYRLRLADDAALVDVPARAEMLVGRVERSLYGTAPSLPGADLARDPLQLFSRFLADLATTPAPFSVDQGLLAGRLDDRWTYVLPLTLNGSAFDFDLQERIRTLGEGIIAQIGAETGASIVSVGVIDFARANRALALQEATLIGSASLLLIVLLLAVTFRWSRAFLAVAVTIGSGILAGLAVSVACFGSIHVLTLVGGTSLIGISVDYAFHLLADGFRRMDGPWQVKAGLTEVLPAVTLGLATSLLGLAGLAASGFVGLQQIAVFSAAGLIGAYLSLPGAYPLLLRGWQPRRRSPLSLSAARAWLRLWRPGVRSITLISIGAALLALALPTGRTDHDVRLLAASSAEIDALLQRSALLSRTLLDSRFYLLRGPDPETLLAREEELRSSLLELRQRGAISHFTQLSQFVPSRQRQEEVLALNRSLYVDPGTAASLLQSRLALKPAVLARLRAALEGPAPPHLDLDAWLASPLAPLAGNLYLGALVPGTVASVVTLAGVTDVEALAALAGKQAGVEFVDNVAALGDVFGLYTQNAIRGLAIAFVLVGALMIARFGWREGPLTLLVPLAAFAGTLWLLQLLGEGVNLFHVVGLTLVLGMGMDYTLFLKSGKARPPTMLAVMLAAATTECAFGLLGFSRVRALHAFGLTVAVGTLLTFLLAPMVAGRDRRSGVES